MQKRATPSAAVEATVARVFAEGTRVFGALGGEPAVLADELRTRLHARLDALGLATDAPEAEALLSRLDAAGLGLATACEAGAAEAWEVLTTSFTPRLVGLAIRRGLAPSEAAGLVDEVMGSLALPAPRSGARTRLGTYLGGGTLFGWLATTVVRRIADRRRGRRTASLEADPVAAARVHADRAAEPPAAAVTRESAGRVADALTRAWAALTPRERLALALKYKDGLTQRAAARVLGVGEPRVSRLVRQALAKVEAPLRTAIGTVEDRQWPALRDAVRARLATLAAELRPPAEGPKPTGVPHES